MGEIKKSNEKLAFVIQRHKASQLHYDFRLEAEGVLKSWAIPKGPSMNPEDKRLAVMVEDHPFDYLNFKGVIPPGNYGAGVVEIWDHGWYTDNERNNDEASEKNILQGISAGNIKIILHGKKVKGEFTLVKTQFDDKRDNLWLLIKHKDKYAVTEAYDSEKFTSKDSTINKMIRELAKKKTAQ